MSDLSIWLIYQILSFRLYLKECSAESLSIFWKKHINEELVITELK